MQMREAEIKQEVFAVRNKCFHFKEHKMENEASVPYIPCLRLANLPQHWTFYGLLLLNLSACVAFQFLTAVFCCLPCGALLLV